MGLATGNSDLAGVSSPEGQADAVCRHKLDAQNRTLDDQQARRSNRLADDRRARFIRAGEEGVVSGKLGANSFGPLGRQFSHDFADDADSMHALVILDELLPWVSGGLTKRGQVKSEGLTVHGPKTTDAGCSRIVYSVACVAFTYSNRSNTVMPSAFAITSMAFSVGLA
jgi:hypothetical protein